MGRGPAKFPCVEGTADALAERLDANTCSGWVRVIT
jgi:hypothetical protein